MSNVHWISFAWIIAASLLGFGISALFSGWFKLSRRSFLIPYMVLTIVFIFAFARWSAVDLGQLIAQNWVVGLIVGLAIAVLLVRNIRSQPRSRQSHGGESLFDLGWLGLVYGIVDALFLNIIPVLAVWRSLAGIEWTISLYSRLPVAILALAASLLVTFAYHAGYPEFRNRKMGLILVGNSLITLAFILSGNPLGALISHTIMHLAAVIQGPETTFQLPPHVLASRSP